MNKFLYIFNFFILINYECYSQNPAPTKLKRITHFDSSYIAKRNSFKTTLIKKDKAPQSFEAFILDSTSVKEVNYQSNGRTLKALLDTSNIFPNSQRPLLVYLHEGFSLGYKDIQNCKPFIDAGYIVFAPSYRGENGNEGNFELFMGEVDDAIESIKWISKQPYVNLNKIFVFGYGNGGAISLLLSYYSTLPIKTSGSCAGLYNYQSIAHWNKEKILPFDYKNKTEIYYRLPLYTLNEMAKRHQMYIGSKDGFKLKLKEYNKLYPNSTKLEIIEVEGNHASSLNESIKKFIKVIK